MDNGPTLQYHFASLYYSDATAATSKDRNNSTFEVLSVLERTLKLGREIVNISSFAAAPLDLQPKH